MTRMNEHKITEADLAIFPPYLSLFLLATLLLMISHGLAATVAFFLLMAIRPEIAFALTIATSLIFVTFNFVIIRGHLWGVPGLKFLSVLYAIIGLYSLFGLGHEDIKPGLSLAILIPSILAYITLQSQKYQTMAQFIAKRWRFYRETGLTVVQALERQRQNPGDDRKQHR